MSDLLGAQAIYETTGAMSLLQELPALVSHLKRLDAKEDQRREDTLSAVLGWLMAGMQYSIGVLRWTCSQQNEKVVRKIDLSMDSGAHASHITANLPEKKTHRGMKRGLVDPLGTLLAGVEDEVQIIELVLAFKAKPSEASLEQVRENQGMDVAFAVSMLRKALELTRRSSAKLAQAKWVEMAKAFEMSCITALNTTLSETGRLEFVAGKVSDTIRGDHARFRFQPIVSLHDAMIVGYEALLELGRPMFESHLATSSTGTYKKLPNHVSFLKLARNGDEELAICCDLEIVRQVLNRVNKWTGEARGRYVSINLTAPTIFDDKQRLRSLLDNWEWRNIERKRVVFEVVEIELADELKKLEDPLKKLRRFAEPIGHSFALDDSHAGIMDSFLSAHMSGFRMYKFNTDRLAKPEGGDRSLVELLSADYAAIVAETLSDDEATMKKQLSSLISLGVQYCQAFAFHRGDKRPVSIADLKKSSAMKHLVNYRGA